MTNPRQWLNRSSIGGALFWLVALGLWWQRPPDLLATVALLLLLAILVNTPLALSLIPKAEMQGRWYGWALWVQPFAALAVAWTLAGTSPRLLTILLTVPWLLFAGLLALNALTRLPRWRQLPVSARVRLVAMLYLPIGAAWLAAYVLNLQPLGFTGVIVLLTAVHFHFTGFAAMIWVSRIGETLAQPHRLYSWAASGFAIATPVIAIGITLSPLLEILGVILLATSLIGLATLVYRHVLPMVTNPWAKVLLSIAPLAMVAALALAVTYGVGEYRQAPC
ncbi:MAG: YndJ family transporter [Caldilineaceae bacterium]